MEQVKQEIDEAYAILSALTASGDAIDIIATVRSKMRKASKLLDDLIAEDDNG